MPRIRCFYIDCAFLDEGYCSAALVELDPDTGCKTFSPTPDSGTEEGWDEEEESEEEWEELEDGEEDEDLWIDEEEDEY